MVLVGIGPEGWTPTQQPLLSSLPPSLASTRLPLLLAQGEGTLKLKLNRIVKETKTILSRPKTERPAGAFSALFSLQCVRFITRGSLVIGDPWV
jgi:hypothetical protein